MTRLERRLKKKAQNRCLKKGHKITGIWSIHDGKSWAECKVCGEYETDLLNRIEIDKHSK